MDKQQLEKFRSWFLDYVGDFYGDDEFANAHYEMKEKHSLRVCTEMQLLSRNLGLVENLQRIAEAIALFHDLGRFKQFAKYRTFNDNKTASHCVLGLEVLRDTNVLSEVEPYEKQLIEKVVEYHGLKELPGNLDGDCLLFARLIRDADKLDVYYVVVNYYKQYRENPEEFMLEMEFPNSQGYTREVVEAVLDGRCVDYSELRNWNDMKLLQLGWVYDVNFGVTLREIKKRNFLKMIVDFMSPDEHIDAIKNKIFQYVDSRIGEQP